MSLRMYKVEFKPLHYLDSLEDKELNFLESLRRDDETYLIEEETLAELIETFKEEELPQQLIQFLRESLKEEGEEFSIIIG